METWVRRAANATKIEDLFPVARPKHAGAMDGYEAPRVAETYPEVGRLTHWYYMIGWERGHDQGQFETLLWVLEGRGLEISDEVRTRITTCESFREFYTWAHRAGTAESTDDLFRESEDLYNPPDHIW